MYKVVRNIGERYFSACFFDTRLEYFENRWTFPAIERSKLFVFNELASAEHFLDGLNSEKVWNIFRCEVRAPIELMKLPIFEVDYVSFWKTGKCGPAFMYAPFGTVCCDAIKLLDLVRQTN